VKGGGGPLDRERGTAEKHHRKSIFFRALGGNFLFNLENHAVRSNQGEKNKVENGAQKCVKETSSVQKRREVHVQAKVGLAFLGGGGEK